MGIYKVCGALPRDSWATIPGMRIQASVWWACAAKKAEQRGICSDRWTQWFSQVIADVRKEEGVNVYCPQSSMSVSGDKVYLKIGYEPEISVGWLKWKCPAAPKFKITNVSFPSSKDQGEEVDGTVTVKNTGTKVGEVRVKLIEVDTGKIIDKEPDLYYKNVDAGQSATFKLGTSWGLGAMPAKNWKLKVEAYRQV